MFLKGTAIQNVQISLQDGYQIFFNKLLNIDFSKKNYSLSYIILGLRYNILTTDASLAKL